MERRHLSLLIFFVLILFVSCKQPNASKRNSRLNDSGDQVTHVVLKSNPYVAFKSDGKSGVKDLQGNTIVPAKFDSISFERGIVVARKGKWVYFFDGDKQVFDSGVDVYGVEEKYISSFNNITGHSALYFYKNKLAVQDIIFCTFGENVFFVENENHHYAFYSLDGTIKAEGLKNLICLRKISKEGRTKQTLFLFGKDDEDDLFIYDMDGNLKYQISLATWQLLGLTYMTRQNDEDNEYEATFTYRINLDEFMHDRAIHRTKEYYPPED